MKTIKLFVLLVCIIFAMSCATLKEEENEFGFAEKSNEVVFDQKFSDSMLAELFKDMPSQISQFLKRSITVFPNPTSSSAWIQIKPIDNGVTPNGDRLINTFERYNFRYELMFEEKIIYKSQIKSLTREIWQDEIPEHLLQNSGSYIVIYEFIQKNNGNVYGQGTVNFMVVKKQ